MGCVACAQVRVDLGQLRRLFDARRVAVHVDQKGSIPEIVLGHSKVAARRGKHGYRVNVRGNYVATNVVHPNFANNVLYIEHACTHARGRKYPGQGSWCT